MFFNRDELNSRAPELPPALLAKAGVKFIAPRDGDHGGSWLLVNEHGLTAAKAKPNLPLDPLLKNLTGRGARG